MTRQRLIYEYVPDNNNSGVYKFVPKNYFLETEIGTQLQCTMNDSKFARFGL